MTSSRTSVADTRSLDEPAAADTFDHDAGRQPLGPASFALTLLTVALWGGTPTAVKYSQELLPSVTIAGVRFALAAFFMLFWCHWEGTGLRLRRGQVLPSIITGVLLFAQISLFNAAISLSNASHSTLFINTFIFWIAVMEHYVTRDDRLTGQKVAGLVIAAVGVGVILLTTESAEAGDVTDAPSLWGDLVMLASAFLLSIKLLYTKRAVKVVEPGKLIFWHDCIGVALFAAYAVLFEQPDLRPFFSTRVFSDAVVRNATLGLLYQGVVVAGFCFAAQAFLLKKHTASSVTVFSFATPLFGMLIAVLLRGDPASPWLFVSAVFIAAGILLVNLRKAGRGVTSTH